VTRVTEVRANYLRAELSEPFGWSVYTTPIRQALLIEVRTDDDLLADVFLQTCVIARCAFLDGQRVLSEADRKASVRLRELRLDQVDRG